MMYSIPGKPNVCPVCGSERQAVYEDDDNVRFRCGAEWALDRLIGHDLKGYDGYICLKQCPWATPIALELLAGKLYDPSVARFMQVDMP